MKLTKYFSVIGLLCMTFPVIAAYVSYHMAFALNLTMGTTINIVAFMLPIVGIFIAMGIGIWCVDVKINCDLINQQDEIHAEMFSRFTEN